MLRRDKMIILLGAGSSTDAKIPHSAEMIKSVEKRLENQWNEFKDLYRFLRSAISFSKGIEGTFNYNPNIEELVNVLSEFRKKHKSTLYPFIGSWSPRLLELSGLDFGKIETFRTKILEDLKDWVQPTDYGGASYYENLFRLQREYNYPLRVFTLNYDMCLEKNVPEGKILERGFDENRVWDWRRFSPDQDAPHIFLYKLHGSIDWERDEESGNVIRESDKTPEIPDLIFGTDYKLQYLDPYLFLAYEFRKYSLECDIMITIGYGFGDDHINGIIRQALQNHRQRKLLIVSPNAEKTRVDLIKSKLQGMEKQISLSNQSAKDYLVGVNLDSIIAELDQAESPFSQAADMN